MYQFTTNAPKGAELLDERYPGWRDRMDRNRFDILSVSNCVAAQIAGRGYFWDGMKDLFPVPGSILVFSERIRALHEEARKYGFILDRDYDDDSDRRPEWNVLQREWELLFRY